VIARATSLVLALLTACAAVPRARVAPQAATPVAVPDRRDVEGVAPSAGPRFAARALALRDGAPDGPVIGRLLPGAAVDAERFDDGGHAEVRLPVFQRIVRVEGGVSPRPLLAWVEADGLRAGPVDAPETPPVEGRRARDHHTRFAAAEDAWPFAWSVCGPITIVEERRDEAGRVVATRASQRRERIELVGWTETPIRGPRGDHPCPPRIVRSEGRVIRVGEPDPGPAPLPEGLVEARPGEVASAITGRARRGGRAWILVHDGERFACEEWRFSGGRPDAEGTSRGSLSHTARDGHEWSRSVYSYEWTGATLLLLGPSHLRRRGGPRGPVIQEMHLGCGSVRELVGGDDARWIWLPGGGFSGAIRGYHPDDAETWFADRASCEAARDAEDETSLSSGC
jgi:hypothetical protein